MTSAPDDDFFRSRPRDVPRRPPWLAPPEDELAALVPDRRILVADATTGVVIALSHIDVFTTGCSLVLRTTIHRRSGVSESDWSDMRDAAMDGRRHPGPAPDGRLPDEVLRFGVAFPDGSRATTVDDARPADPRETPAGPLLTEQGRGGSGSHSLTVLRSELWLWPLPPPEPFDLVFEWPAFGVDVTRVALDGARMRVAVDEVRQLP